MHGGHTRLKGRLKKYHKKLLMKHSPGPTPLWFTTTNGKGPSKWKMETDKHSSFEVLYPRGGTLMVEVWRPAPSKIRIYPGSIFPTKKWSTYCKYFFFDKYEACVGATPILLPAINGHHCWQPPPIQPPCASQTTKTHNGQKVYK